MEKFLGFSHEMKKIFFFFMWHEKNIDCLRWVNGRMVYGRFSHAFPHKMKRQIHFLMGHEETLIRLLTKWDR
jgi:hypothetical protein